jgi:hypothetical protein
LESLGISLIQLEYKEINIPDRKLINNPKAIISYFFLLKKVLHFANLNNCKKLSFLSIYTYNLIPLKFILAYKYKSNFSLQIIMHGTLEFVKRKNHSFFLNNASSFINKIKNRLGFKPNKLDYKIENKFLYEKLFKLSINVLPLNNITYLLMRVDAEKSVRKYLPKINLNFRGIDLPYITKNISLSNKISSKLEITFATFGKGYINETKNLIEFLVKNPILENSFNFQIIGGNEDDNLNKYRQVNYPIKKEKFTRNEIEVALNNVDYIVFFYEADSYELTTSGAFFDAIAYGKPVIFIKNKCFDYYYEKFNFGYSYDNIDTLIADMPNIFMNHSTKYSIFLNEIKKMQNLTSINHRYTNLIFTSN